jgi:hypothetical protein
MSSEAPVNKCRTPTPDVRNAPDPHSEDTSAEMNACKAGSPAPSHIGGCRKTFPFAVTEWHKLGDAGEEVSEAKRTSRGRVKRVVALPASFAAAWAIPPTCTSSYVGISSPTTAEGDKRGLDDNSRDVMSSEPAAGDKRSALNALKKNPFHASCLP